MLRWIKPSARLVITDVPHTVRRYLFGYGHSSMLLVELVRGSLWLFVDVRGYQRAAGGGLGALYG